jgi:S1-C subfamily serine protease
MRRSTGGAAARGREAGFTVVAALLIAILFFGLIGLLLVESAEAYRNAQRFRARVTAFVMAGNAVEIAAAGIVSGAAHRVDVEIDGYQLTAEVQRAGERFVITAASVRSGGGAGASVRVEGRVVGSSIEVFRTLHRDGVAAQ